MPTYKLECLYCGKIWIKTVYYTIDINIKCGVCNDKNIKAKEIDVDNGDVFGYGKDIVEDKDYVGV